MDKTLLIVIAAIVVVFVGFIAYTSMTTDEEVVSVVPTSTPVTSSTTAEIEAQWQRDRDEQVMRDEAAAKTVAFKIDVTKLPEAQRLTLKTMGVTSTSIDITNAMVACAEADLSSARVVEIKGGASLSVSEGIKFVSCYNAK